MKSIARILTHGTATVAAALALALPAAAADDLIRITPAQATKAGIAVAALTELKSPAELRLPAQVVVPPGQIEVLAAPLATMVAGVRVAYGETVKKGQTLLRLQGGQLLELQRDYVGARAQAQLAAENRRRDEALFADGIIPQSRLSVTRANEAAAAALASEKRQALRFAGAGEPAADGTLSGTAEIRAPFDAVVIEAPAQPGQRVDALTPLLKLGRLSPLWLEIQASPTQAERLAAGDAVAVPGCREPARVTLVAPQMQAASQSQLVRAELAAPAGCVKPFQFVQVAATPARPLRPGTLRVPPAALTRHKDGVWLFVEASGGFRPVAARVIDETPAATTVAADLPTDAKVAVKGVATIKAVWLGLGSGE